MRVTPAMEERGFTLIEVMIVFAIIAVVASLALPQYLRYTVRAKAAGVAVEAEPIRRAIQEFYGSVDKSRYRMQLINGADGSIAGCQAPAGAGCGDAGAAPVVLLVTPERLLIAAGNIRVSAAPCHVDCPAFALNFSSDLSVTGTWTPLPASSAGATPAAPSGTVPTDPASPATAPTPPDPASPPTSTAAPAPPATAPGATDPATAPSGTVPAVPPATSPATPPATDPIAPPDPDAAGKGQGKGKGKGQSGTGPEDRPGSRTFSWRSVPLVPSAHAVTLAHAAGNDYEQTNRVLYEFGEVMRRQVHAADNAGCILNHAAPCTVTVKYRNP